MKTEIEETVDLISDLINIGSGLFASAIPYKEGSIYDRVLNNFKEYANVEVLTGSEKYSWTRFTSEKGLMRPIWLTKPGKFSKIVEEFDPFKGRFYSRHKNCVRLDFYYYYSSIDPKVQAVTFGDRKRVIQPLKILDHKWFLDSINCSHADHYDYYGTIKNYKCETCGMMGKKIDKFGDKIIPNKFFNCDEFSIMDVLE